MLGTDMEHSLILVVSQLKVLFRRMEVFFKHRNIVLLQSVVQWQIAIVVDYVRPWADLIDDGMLLVDAHDVLDGLALVVLGATCLKELIVAAEPIENVLVAVTSTFEKWIFTKVVALRKGLVLVLCKDLEHFHILTLNGNIERRVSLEVRLHALFRSHLKQLLDQVDITDSHGHMQWCVTFHRVPTPKQVQVRELFSVHQVVDNLSPVLLHSSEEARLALYISSLEQIAHLFRIGLALCSCRVYQCLESFKVA